MTLAEVRERVLEIIATAGDPEAAHCKEDALRRDVLYAIAMGREEGCEPAELAALALTSKNAVFERWAG